MNATCAVYMSPGGRIGGWSLVPLFSSVSRSGGRPNSIHLLKWKKKICSDEYLITDHSCFRLNNSQIRETMSQCAGQKTRNMWNLGNLKKAAQSCAENGDGKLRHFSHLCQWPGHTCQPVPRTSPPAVPQILPRCSHLVLGGPLHPQNHLSPTGKKAGKTTLKHKETFLESIQLLLLYAFFSQPLLI